MVSLVLCVGVIGDDGIGSSDAMIGSKSGIVIEALFRFYWCCGECSGELLFDGDDGFRSEHSVEYLEDP